MKNKKRVSLLLAAVLVMALLSGCGDYHSRAAQESEGDVYYSSGSSSWSGASGGVNGLAMGAVKMQDAAVAAESYASDYDFAEYAEYEEAAEAPVPAPQETSAEAQKTDKIIYSANATVETTKFEETIENLEKMIEQYGGWVESSGTNSSSYSNIQRGKASNRSASYTIRVPGENFSTMMHSLTNLGNVPSSNIYTENVTSQYYDTAARMSNYKAQEKRLVELLDMAETVSDVIEIENELTEVRYRIESLQTQLNGWDRRVSYSTIYLSVNEVKEYTPEKTVSYGRKLINALKYGVEDLGDFLIDFVGALPILIVLAAIVWVVVILMKKLVSASKTRRKNKKAQKEQETEKEK